MLCNRTPVILSAARTAGGSTEPRLLLLLAVANCDLQPGGVDPELRLALQWIAASELGIPALHFRRSEDVSAAKVGGATQPMTLMSFLQFLAEGIKTMY